MAGKILTVLFLIAFSDALAVESLKLKQVVILGRHNVRTPLMANLEKLTPKTWPKWKESVGYLTEKGAILESYMGDYFSKWLNQKGIFNGCPNRKSVYIYANAVERTRESAKVFAKSAFKNCNVSVYTKPNVETDPVFHPVIMNTTESFKDIVLEEMQKKLNELELTEAYSFLTDVLEFNISQTCMETQFCDLVRTKDEIVFEIGEEPDIAGPLQVGNSVVDAFLMAYYNGLPLKDIAWGEMRPGTWDILTRITKENQNVRFNSTVLARDVAKPLLKLFYKLFSNEDLKFALLVGHDSNINSVIASLGFQPFILKNNYEKTPVGGKVIFQKLYSAEDDKHYLKIDYVYQTTEQLRRGTRLSLENPPRFVTLELLECKTNENGHCPWKDFISVLQELQ